MSKRKRQNIDIEWFEKALENYLKHLGLTVTSMEMFGRPDDLNPTNGVIINIKVLGQELPTPEEYMDAMKALFKGEFFILPEEERKLPEDCSEAIYLGSAKNRYMHFEDVLSDEKKGITMHYFLLDEDVLAFNDAWESERPRSLLISYESLLMWTRLLH